MAQQDIGIGAANAGEGDDYFTAFTKIQDNFSDLYSSNIFTKRVLVNVLADFPSPVSGLITLAANTQYMCANDIEFGVNEVLYGERSVIAGIESLVITLTYLGTGDFFTMTNTTNRVDNVTISAPNGRIFNWSSTSGAELRVTDIQCSSARFGTFTGSSSLLRFSFISPSFTADGLEFAGSWASVLWEVSGANVQAGTFFKLGTATFNSFLVDKVLMTLGATATFISGLASSANISAGGLGTILLTRISGTGTVLSGISPDDAFWEFFHNDEIADTRPDALLSMQNNAVQTVIAAVNTPVLVAGVWTIKDVSQMTADPNGRTTYIGGKDAKLPVTYSVSVEPVSGTNIKMSAFVAIDGVVDVDSKRSGTGSAGSPTSITIPWQDTFSTNQYHEVFVENNDTTSNVIVSSAISRTN